MRWDQVIFRWDTSSITVRQLALFAVTLVAAYIAGRVVRAIVQRAMMRREGANIGVVYALARMTQYVVVLVGTLVAVENLGVSLTTLAAAGALLSVGIGLGLQSLTQNFVSGVLLLIERPIAQGDYVRLGDGELAVVTEIGLRSTRLFTLDGTTAILPNSKLVSEEVRNLHAPDTRTRIRIRIGVSYGSDPEAVRAQLLAVAAAHAEVVDTPEPIVLFVGFGDSSLDFELAAWVKDAGLRLRVGSDLRFAIVRALREADITIPFPQRDLHVKEWPSDGPRAASNV